MKSTALACLFFVLNSVCCLANPLDNTTPPEDDFKIVGYVSAGKMNPSDIPYEYLTHINYAFVIPEKEADGHLSAVPQPDSLRAMVKQAHRHNVEVFMAIGGWNIGDGGGDDTRFEKLADDAKSRTIFTNEVLKLITTYNLDGVDIDWEYPDPILPSSNNYVELMTELKDSLHPKHKKLTAAVVSYHDKHGYGIDKEIFDIVDWLNIMAYDDDYNTFDGANVPHAPYWLAKRAFEYWIEDRGLTQDKAIMGVPFYGKKEGKGMNYDELIAKGADPYADVYKGYYYNGIKTIKAKTALAKKHGNGIMIWEIPLDDTGAYSLLKAIYEEAQE